MITEIAKNIPRFSIVNYELESYMIENKANSRNKVHLTNGDKSVEIHSNTILKVVAYPAQLAKLYLGYLKS